MGDNHVSILVGLPKWEFSPYFSGSSIGVIQSCPGQPLCSDRPMCMVTIFDI